MLNSCKGNGVLFSFFSLLLHCAFITVCLRAPRNRRTEPVYVCATVPGANPVGKRNHVLGVHVT